MLCSSVLGTAQEGKESLSFGLTLGGNVGAVMPFPFSNIPDERYANMLLRPALGVTAIKSLSDKWQFQVDFKYTVKSVDFAARVVDQPYSGYILQEVHVNGNTMLSEGNVHDAFFTGDTKGGFILSYLQLNLMLKRRLGKTNAIHFGIYTAYNVYSRNVVDIEGTVSLGEGRPPISTVFTRRLDYSEDIRKIDFGLVIGAEQRIYRNINLTLGLSSGLTSVYQVDFESIPFSMLNMYSTLGVVWYFSENVFDRSDN